MQPVLTGRTGSPAAACSSALEAGGEIGERDAASAAANAATSSGAQLDLDLPTAQLANGIEAINSMASTPAVALPVESIPICQFDTTVSRSERQRHGL